MNALNHSVGFQFAAWHATDALRAKIGVFRLDASQAAQVFVSGTLPLCNEHRIRHALLQTPFIQLTADGLSLVIQIVNVARSLVVNLKDGPARLDDAFSLMCRIFHCIYQTALAMVSFSSACVPSRSLRSNSLMVGSMSCQPSGAGFLRPNFFIVRGRVLTGQ